MRFFSFSLNNSENAGQCLSDILENFYLVDVGVQILLLGGDEAAAGAAEVLPLEVDAVDVLHQRGQLAGGELEREEEEEVGEGGGPK